MTNAFQTLRPKAPPGPTKAPRAPRMESSPFNKHTPIVDMGQEREAKKAAALEREILASLNNSRKQRGKAQNASKRGKP